MVATYSNHHGSSGEALLAHLERVTKVGSDKHRACCPVCGSRNATTLSIIDRDGFPACHCFKCKADTAAVLEALGLTWRDLFQGTERLHHQLVPVKVPKTPDVAQQSKLERLWNSAKPLRAGDLVMKYLESRGIPLPTPPLTLRLHPGLEYWHWPEGAKRSQLVGVYPAMLARVQHLEHGLVALHRTYLEVDGNRVIKARVPSPKKLTKPVYEGAVNGGAIRLWLRTPTGCLALAEGIETAVAVYLATQHPVWACVSAGGLEAVQIPKEIREILIAADNDNAGLEAAHNLAHRLALTGARVRVATPPKAGSDWLDVWQAERKVVKDGH